MLEESGLEYDEGYLGVDGDVFDPFRVRFSLLCLLRGLREALARGY